MDDHYPITFVIIYVVYYARCFKPTPVFILTSLKIHESRAAYQTACELAGFDSWLSFFSPDRHFGSSGAIEKPHTDGQCFAEEAFDMGVSGPQSSLSLPNATAPGPRSGSTYGIPG